MSLPPAAVPVSVSKRMAVEFIGTALLLATIVGSRLVGERLSGGMVGITYLVNTLATASVIGMPVFSWPNPPRATLTEITGELLERHAVVPLPEALDDADLFITLGSARDWQALVDVVHVHWELPALAGLESARSHQVVEEVRVRVKQLLRELGVERLRGV
ncbi:hypothetical protein [Hyalangium minutum]|uniref:Protein-tyrosine-phosphatase n=1 Tax=Hyalangium minutum TaxID=394096 RepID=A0A085WQD1_9BACT|nr:hypothetical protein [Hyalangium minutum]KFE69894.1 hypothetical protein DB31_4936 [Hyalangium minutum]